MKPLRCLFVATGILALGVGSLVFAQTVTGPAQQITVTAIIPVMMNLTVDTSTVTLSFTQSDYASGTGSKEVVSATTFQVASNTDWILYVAADNRNFTYQPHQIGLPLEPRKDCNDLSVSANGTSNYFPVDTSDTELTRGNAGGTGDLGHTIPVSYRLVSSLANDPPGSYALTLTYTLMPQ